MSVRRLDDNDDNHRQPTAPAEHRPRCGVWRGRACCPVGLIARSDAQVTGDPRGRQMLAVSISAKPASVQMMIFRRSSASPLRVGSSGQFRQERLALVGQIPAVGVLVVGDIPAPHPAPE